MQILSVVGARPQFVKLAPIAEAVTQAGYEHVIVHTGQHYDERLSDVFFADLKIPAPDINLAIGSAGHGAQTGAMLARLEEVFLAQRPSWVLVYGDTNSTLAGALAAVKLHMPVAHLEAGLRSFNRAMPEEHNRVLTDHAADLLLAPTEVALAHLTAEGLASRAVLVGDVMTDICYRVRDAVAGTAPPLPAAPQPQTYFLATIHRAENTDDAGRLAQIIAALRNLPAPVYLLAHPRLVDRCRDANIELSGGSLRTMAPLAYPDMVAAVQSARGVITDSGGLQKEAYLLGVPVTTVRTETEWVETLADGWNVLAGDPADLEVAALRARPTAERAQPYGDGAAAQKVVAQLAANLP